MFDIPPRQIFYPGIDRQPCRALYGIALTPPTDGRAFTHATIVAVQRTNEGGTSLVNADGSRDHLLNNVLASDLAGVRTDCVRFVIVMHDRGDKRYHAWELPIRADLDDYMARGGPHEDRSTMMQRMTGGKAVSVLSSDVVGGSAYHYSDFENRRAVPRDETVGLLASIGYIDEDE